MARFEDLANLEDLAHLEQLAAVGLDVAERPGLLADLQAIADLADRLPVAGSDEPAAGGPAASLPAAPDEVRPVTFRRKLIVAGFPGWAPPFVVVPGFERDGQEP